MLAVRDPDAAGFTPPAPAAVVAGGCGFGPVAVGGLGGADLVAVVLPGTVVPVGGGGRGTPLNSNPVYCMLCIMCCVVCVVLYVLCCMWYCK